MSNRRQFCQGLVLISIASAVEACTGSPTGGSGDLPSLPVINATLTGGKISLNVDSNSALSSVGSAAVVQTSSGDLLVARTAQSTFSALTTTCTHQICTITEFQGTTFQCPCHGSQFSTTGAVIRGPANAPLRQFATVYTAPTLTITVA